MNTITIERLGTVCERQTVQPTWLRQLLDEHGPDRLVKVTTQNTFAGNFLLSVELTEAEPNNDEHNQLAIGRIDTSAELEELCNNISERIDAMVEHEYQVASWSGHSIDTEIVRTSVVRSVMAWLEDEMEGRAEVQADDAWCEAHFTVDEYIEQENEEDEEDEAHCYLCYLDATGKPDDSMKLDQGPLRKVLRHSTCNPADPTDVLHLSCGHAII